MPRQIYQIIDSLELNGGSTMFLEIVAAMQEYLVGYTIVPFVVSKTGYLGRSHLVNTDLSSSYGIDISVTNYESFASIAKASRDAVVFHHVLGHTKNIQFDNSCKYFIVNHTVTNMHRLSNFKNDGIISVCNYFANSLKRRTGLNSFVILNGCKDYYESRKAKNEKFVIGCCQRVVPSKFNTKGRKLPLNCVRHVVGPCSVSIRTVKDCHFFGPIFDKKEKIKIIGNFDVYLHDTLSPEGASMALLEALSLGIPVLARSVGGGTNELIKHGVNGYFFNTEKDLFGILQKLSTSTDRLMALQKSTRKDFLSRLHIKHTVDKYEKIINSCMDRKLK